MMLDIKLRSFVGISGLTLPNPPQAVTAVGHGQDRNVFIINWLLLPSESYVSWARDRTKEQEVL